MKMKTVVVLTGLVTVLSLQRASAFSSYQSRIPNGTAVAVGDSVSCEKCHGPSGPPLNPFGTAFFNANLAWSAALANMDSDGDGSSNGVELGDPNGTWVAGQPNPGGTVYNPGNASSHPPAANVPPTVSLTAPANGATFTAPASITVSATAADSDGTVAQVQFFAGTTPIGTDTTSPYSINWNNVAAGTYTLTAVATDNSGASTTSASRTITVNPAANVPPTVSLTAPANGATFTAPASITVSATAADSDGTVAQVQFFAGTTPIGTDTTSPYSINWNNVAAGTYTLTAVATDNSGASTTSAARTITVNTAPPPAVTIRITSPANGAMFAAPATFALTAEAAPLASVTRVDFYQGSTLLGGLSAGPFTFTVANLGGGSYTYRAVATTTSSSTVTSAPVSITVTAQPPPPGNPVVTVVATDPNASEVGPDPGVFRISRTGDTTAALTVNYLLSGTALNGVDYQTLPSSATIPAGAASADITVIPIPDQDSPPEVSDTVVLQLAGASAGQPGYTIGSPAQAVITIKEAPGANQPPVVRIVSPRDGSRYSGRNVNIPLVALASDPDGSVVSVQFFAGTQSLGMGVLVPRDDDGEDSHDGESRGQVYVFAWRNVPAGQYVITAVATDDGGATTTSAPVNITVTGRRGGADSDRSSRRDHPEDEESRGDSSR